MTPRHRPAARPAAALAALAALLLAVAPPTGAAAAVSSGLPPDTSTAVSPVAAPTAARPAAPGVVPLRAHGFASGATGGGGGRVVTVTSDSDDPLAPAPGTLRWALSQTGPTWVVFARDMTVRLTAPLQVGSDTTIDGRGRDVTLTGPGTTGLSIADADNVIVENLTLTDFGDPAQTAENDPDDAIIVQGSTRVWIDHCSLARAGDKLIGIQGGAQVTVSWNHFADQKQTLQVGSLATADLDVDATVTVDHNWFDHVGYRLPVVSYGKAHVYNNYLDQWRSSAIRSERLAQVLVEGNVFRVGPSKKASTTTVGQDCNDADTMCDTREGYLTNRDNTYLGKVVTADTGPAHVFDPAQAYAYAAEPASERLASTVAARAGAQG